MADVSLERDEGLPVTHLQDEPEPSHPVGLLSLDQVAQHVARAEGLHALVRLEPGSRQAVEQRSLPSLTFPVGCKHLAAGAGLVRRSTPADLHPGLDKPPGLADLINRLVD